jgi:hypothetical protein
MLNSAFRRAGQAASYLLDSHPLLRSHSRALSAFIAIALLALIPWVAYSQSLDPILIFKTHPEIPTDNSYGYHVAGIGDVSGDGIEDFAATVGNLAVLPPNDRRGKVHIYSGADSELLFSFVADDLLQGQIDGLGDVNNDKVPDFIVGAPGVEFGGVIDRGGALVISGATGDLIYGLPAEIPDEGFGKSVAGLGDLDGDGAGDFAVGAPNAVIDGQSRSGAVYVYSGASGTLRFKLQGGGIVGDFGFSVAPVADLDGDRIGDLLVGAPFSSPEGATRSGLVFAFSGGDGEEINRYDIVAASQTEDALGASVAGIEDLDGDNVPDVVAGAPGHNLPLGAVFVFSSLKGSRIYRILGRPSEDKLLGNDVSASGDVDGDGVGDIVAGARGGGAGKGSVRIISGADGRRIGYITGRSPNGGFGADVDILEDLDSDGRAEFIIGAPGERPSGEDVPRGAAYGYGMKEVYPVTIDILPEACPNVLQSPNRRQLRVALLGTEEFDVTDVAPGLAKLQGVLAHKEIPAPQDVGGADPSAGSCDCGPKTKDGISDRVYFFDARQVLDRLEEGGPDGTHHLVFIASLDAGTVVRGEDCLVLGGAEEHERQLLSSPIRGHSISEERGSELSSDELGVLSLTIRPNPVSGRRSATLAYVVPGAGARVEVGLYAVSGRKVANVVQGWQSGGEHTATLWGHDTELTPGIYFVRVRVGDREESGRVLYVR